MPEKIRPSVVLGLGGFGKEVLMRVRRMIVENYGSLEQLPVVQFLHVDTDKNLAWRGKNEVLGQDISLHGDQRLDLSDKIVSQVGHDVESVRRDLRVAEWLPPEFALTSDFSKGAGGIRACGRLAFQYSVLEYRQKLYQAATQANNPNNATRVFQNLGFESDGKLSLLMVCSLIGGTGSGSFLEAAYNAREALRELGAGLSVVGTLLIGADGLDDTNRANCYGALKELEYFSTNELDSSPGRHPFRIEYPVPGGIRIDNRSKPFDYCYLTNWINENGEQDPGEQFYENVARNLLLEFMPGISGKRNEKRVDMFGAGGRNNLDKKLKRFQGYSAFGLSVEEFPAIRIRDYLASVLGEYSLSTWQFETAPDMQDAPRVVHEFLKEHRLEEASLLKALLLVTGRDLESTANLGLTNSQGAVDEQIRAKEFSRDAIVNAIEKNLSQWQSFVKYDPQNPDQYGEAVKSIHSNARRILQESVQTLKDRIAEMCGRDREGPKNALRLLTAVQESVKSLGEGIRRQLATYEQSVRAADKNILERKQKLYADMAPQFRDELLYHSKLFHQEALKNYVRLSLYKEAFRSAESMLFVDSRARGEVELCLTEEISALKSQVTTYLERLRALQERFFKQKLDLQNNLLNQPIVGGIALTKSKLSEEEKRILPNLEKISFELLGKLQAHFGMHAEDGLLIKPERVFTLFTKKFSETEALLRSLLQELCNSAREHSIAGELIESGNMGSIISNRIRLAAPMLRLRGLQDETDHLPTRNHYCWIGTAKPQSDSAVSKVTEYVRQQRGDYIEAPMLTDKYQLIFAEEKAVFPLRCVDVLESYRQAYINLARNVSVPRETDRRIEFPDIFPEDNRIVEIRRRAGIGYVAGRAVGLLLQQINPETQYDAIAISYFDEKSRNTFSEFVCDSWDSVENVLVGKQIEKEIDRVFTSRFTPLEHLEARFKELAADGLKREAKEALWVKTQGYLTALSAEIDGGERNPEYQRQLRILQEFRDRLNLRPPAETHRVAPTQTARQGGVTTVSVSEDARNRFQDYARKLAERSGGLKDSDRPTWSKYGKFFCKLDDQTMEALIAELALASTSASEASLNEYDQHVGVAVADGHFDEAKRAQLERLRSELGISTREARRIEASHLEPLYQELLDVLRVNGVVDVADRRTLEEQRTLLAIAPERAREIERSPNAKGE